MNMFEQILTEEERTKLIKKKASGIRKVLGKLAVDTSRLEIFKDLIDDAAAYATSIYECRLLYQRDGLCDVYQNGENQFGIKKSVCAELRPKYTKAYQDIIKQLMDLLPDENGKDATQELMDFLNK